MNKLFFIVLMTFLYLQIISKNLYATSSSFKMSLVLAGEKVSILASSAAKNLTEFESWPPEGLKESTDTSQIIPILIIENQGPSGSFEEEPQLILRDEGGEEHRITAEIFCHKMLEIRRKLNCPFYILFKSSFSLSFVKRLTLLGADDYCDAFLSWEEEIETSQLTHLQKKIYEIFKFYHHFKETAQMPEADPEADPEENFISILEAQLSSMKPLVNKLAITGLFKKGFKTYLTTPRLR